MIVRGWFENARTTLDCYIARVGNISAGIGFFFISFPAFGSNSHRNLERAGLRIAYTKTMWYERSIKAR
jgi:hypothetical protein